jgi:bifunctional NMN adenylyltransferase/nudix hydrolase
VSRKEEKLFVRVSFFAHKGEVVTQKKNYSYDFCVFIGRFQPFHKGHQHTVKIALQQSKKLIVVLGSYRLAPAPRVPWDACDRKKMILAAFEKAQHQRFLFVFVRDRLHCEDLWKQNILGEISKHTSTQQKIALIGHCKDSSSFYLKMFPNWDFIETNNYKNIHATDFRENFFLQKNSLSLYKDIPDGTAKWLRKYQKTKSFQNIKDQFLWISKKRDQDVVICSAFVFCGRYILLVKRQTPLCQNLWSLPEIVSLGQESLLKLSLQAVQKETCFQWMEKLESCYCAEAYFECAENSSLGRQRKYVFCYKWADPLLPEVFPGQEIKNVEWILLDDLYLREHEMYSDTFQMITWFLQKRVLF